MWAVEFAKRAAVATHWHSACVCIVSRPKENGALLHYDIIN